MDDHPYVSNELSHFVGRQLKTEPEKQFELLIEILGSGALKHGPFGPGFDIEDKALYSGGGMVINPDMAFSSEEMYKPNVVCFCDIPLGALQRHMATYSSFGLSFDKSFLVGMGALPVWYVAKDSRPSNLGTWSDTFDVYVPVIRKEFFKNEIPNPEAIKAGVPPEPQSGEEWVLEQFLKWTIFSFVKFFDSTLPDDDPANVYMEREWRTNRFVYFELGDVRRIIVPKEYRERVAAAFPKYRGEWYCPDD